MFTCTAGSQCAHARRGGSGGSDGWRGTQEQFGYRKDGRPNTRCPACRGRLASSGGYKRHAVARQRRHEVPRDVKALRVVERWSGFEYRATKCWTTPEAVRWQWKRGCSLQDVWAHRMRRLADRAERCAAARERIRTRQLANSPTGAAA